MLNTALICRHKKGSKTGGNEAIRPRPPGIRLGLACLEPSLLKPGGLGGRLRSSQRHEITCLGSYERKKQRTFVHVGFA